jgi:hypothetical protein
MDLTSYTDPYVNFNRWFYCYFGAPPNDTMKILLSNGLEIAVIDMIGGEVNEPSWQFRGIRVSDFLAITNSMQIRVRESDFDPDVNITEAGFDRFFVSEGDVTGVSEMSTDFSISPNPFNEILDVKGVESESDFVLYDALGAVVLKGVVSQVDAHIDTHNLQSGLYVLNINGAVFRVIKD